MQAVNTGRFKRFFKFSTGHIVRVFMEFNKGTVLF